MDELVFLQGQEECEWLKDAVCPGKPGTGHGAPSSATSLPPPPSLHLTPLTILSPGLKTMPANHQGQSVQNSSALRRVKPGGGRGAASTVKGK